MIEIADVCELYNSVSASLKLKLAHIKVTRCYNYSVFCTARAILVLHKFRFVWEERQRLKWYLLNHQEAHGIQHVLLAVTSVDDYLIDTNVRVFRRIISNMLRSTVQGSLLDQSII